MCVCLIPSIPREQGGDKLTLSLNNAVTNAGNGAAPASAGASPSVSSTTNGDAAGATVAKLINLDSPDDGGGGGDGSGVVSSTTTEGEEGEKGEKSESVCVTHFSSTGDGSGGVERETIFSDAIASMLSTAANNPFAAANGQSSSNNNNNPFLETNGVLAHEANPFRNGHDGNGEAKYATIGRSNPFSSSSSNANSNPFLDDPKKPPPAAADPTPALSPELITASTTTTTTKTLNKIVSCTTTVL